MKKNTRKAIILFGPPGAGKGTYAKRLVSEFNLVHISTGDILRDAIEKKTSLGSEVKKYLDRGELVPDRIMIPVVEGKIKEENPHKGFLLDGFPRNTYQAEALDKIVKEKNIMIKKVIYLKTPKDIILQRLPGRRVCSKCGAIYHLINSPPKIDGICDVCGGVLYQRKDDSEEMILRRLSIYEEQTADVIEYYRRKGILIEIDGGLPVDESYPIIRKSIK